MQPTVERPAPGPGERRPLGDLVQSLIANASTLFRQEIELAKAELARTLRRVAGDLVGLAVGGAVAFVGALVLVAAAVLGLATILPARLSALIVGAALLATGVAMLTVNLRAVRSLEVAPERTVRTLRDDVRLVRETLS